MIGWYIFATLLYVGFAATLLRVRYERRRESADDQPTEGGKMTPTSRLMMWWYGLGMKWTEHRCRRKGGDYYSTGRHRIVRALGWF